MPRSGLVIIALGLLVTLVAPARARTERQYPAGTREDKKGSRAQSVSELADSSVLASGRHKIRRGEPFRSEWRNKEIVGRSDLPVREESFHRFQVAQSAVIEVSQILGPVEIEATDSDRAEVFIVRSAYAQADLDRFDRIIVEQNHARLALCGEDSKSNGIAVHHYVQLRVPRSSRVSLREINGRVSINGIEGAIWLNGVNGDARLSQVAGEAEMSAINGKVTFSLARLVPKGICLRDVASVELGIADEINAELELDKLKEPPMTEVARVSLKKLWKGRFDGRIGSGGPVIRILDVGGRVRIHGA
jgi:hypothetical protein